MFIPMILKMFSIDLELGTALLDPFRRPSAVLMNQPLNVSDTFALCDDAGLGQHSRR